jgi:hypothetical protein
VAHETHGAGIRVGARLARRGDAAVGGYEERHVLVPEEVLIALQLDLESQPIAQGADRQAGAAPSKFDVAREVGGGLGRDHPLRLRGRGDRGGAQEEETNLADLHVLSLPVASRFQPECNG